MFLHLLGLLLQLFEALLEAALFLLLALVAGMLLVIGGHACAYFLLAGEATDEHHGAHGEGERDEVVEVQPRALAVEDEEGI